MYQGDQEEHCKTKELFQNPCHPYTQALLSAIPRPNLDKKQNRISLKGEITSPINPGPGCRFASRCMYAQEICRTQTPVFDELSESHFVACHRARQLM